MTTTPPPIPFPFPREYFFPAFFTRQTNLNTLHAQLVKWAALVLAYCRHHRIFKLPLTPDSSTTIAATATTNTSSPSADELFHNRRINRRLALADVREVIDFMRKDGRAEYVSDGSSGGGGDVVWIYWRTPEEWGALIEAWVDSTGQKGTVLTLYELVEGEGTMSTEFHGLDYDLLQKALNTLVKRGKAQIFGQEDSQGVKFF
ncbi:hypothetical protein N0V93_002424 [Gnomoniopsis smithogilvyi]|uniref:ESCRT-II complex subunit VPS25 n=1 Tax=Gnomoniopsis smithogilvyi TaxID=1191159 RepID=A0A9W8YWI0_9PEZI|nr:hypothetical protein N0V93_002424 [Gnomoniopsis smithogilvyi]